MKTQLNSRDTSPDILAALYVAQTLQEAFWRALRSLELAAGFEIDSTLDLGEYTLTELRTWMQGNESLERPGS